MDIGNKIKNARIQAKLTQQQAAEAIGVSRQTISNWENGKTYPDIVSVVKMSDVYHISLDALLKEEQTVSDYVSYLGESTDMVKSKARLSGIILLVTYLIIWVAGILYFYFLDFEYGLGYNIMFLGIILPITTLILSVIVGKTYRREKGKWFLPIGLGVMYMLAEYATFSAANMAAFHHFVMPEYAMILVGAIFSLIGIGIGTGIARMRWKRQKSE